MLATLLESVSEIEKENERKQPESEVKSPVYLIIAAPDHRDLYDLFENLADTEIDVYLDDSLMFGSAVNEYHGKVRSFILQVKPSVIYCLDWVADIVIQLVELMGLSDKIRVPREINISDGVLLRD